MKQKNFLTKIFTLSLVVLITISGCKKEDSTDNSTDNTDNDEYPASIVGFLTLYDQYGSKQLTNMEGIEVSVEGSSTKVYTDSAGRYEINGLTTGNYNIDFNDTSNVYGEDKILALQVVSDTVYRDVKLSQVPSFSLNSCSAVDTSIQSVDYIKVVVNASSSDTYTRSVVVFVGTSSNVTSNPSTYLLLYPKSLTGGNTSCNVTIPLADLYGAGFTSGSTLYVAAYPAAINYSSSSSYEDFNTGRTVYNAIGSTAVTTTITVQ